MVVIAMGLPDSADGREALSMARRETDRQRAIDALAIHLSALHPGAVVAAVGSVGYGILPVVEASEAAEERAVRIAWEFVNGPEPGPAGISASAAPPRTSRGCRAHAGTPTGRCVCCGTATAAEWSPGRPRCTSSRCFCKLADLAAAEGWELTGPIARLRDYDRGHRSDLTATLAAWLDAAGDVTAAAAAVHVHVNTFRYRLRRITEVGGIDLDDADSRFAAMLQLRLLRDSTPRVPRVPRMRTWQEHAPGWASLRLRRARRWPRRRAVQVSGGRARCRHPARSTRRPGPHA